MPEEVSKTEKSGDKEGQKAKAQKKSRTFLNKIIIRKLPPNLTSDLFIETIQPIPDYSDLYFVQADWSLGAEATSRAYIEFKNPEDVSCKILKLCSIMKLINSFYRFTFSKKNLMITFLSTMSKEQSIKL